MAALSTLLTRALPFVWKIGFTIKKLMKNFANAVLKETINEKEPFILIQDYHFALLPALIKKKTRSKGGYFLAYSMA